MKHLGRIGAFLAIFALFGGLLMWPQAAAQGAREGLKLCAEVAIPALFPFLVLTSMAVSLGAAAVLGKLLLPVTGPLFRLGGASSALALGLLGGYPAGAQAVRSLYEQGQCSRTQAERALAFCNNCGCRLAEPAPRQDAPAMQAPARFCMSCGVPMAPDAIFCMSCGARFEAKPAQAAPAPAAAQAPEAAQAAPKAPEVPAAPAAPKAPEAPAASAQPPVEDSAPAYEDSAPAYSVSEEATYAYAEPETPDAQQD
jgi:hypothetical protein